MVRHGKAMSGKGGFSMMGSIVGMAIAMMGAVVLFRVLIGANNQRANLSRSINMEITKMSVTQVLNSNQLCPNAFKQDVKLTPLSFVIPSPTNPNSRLNLFAIASDNGTDPPSKIVERGPWEASSQMRIKELYFRYQRQTGGAPVPAAVNVPAPGQSTHFVELILERHRRDDHIKKESERDQFHSDKLRTFWAIPLVIVRDDATNDIVDCKSSTSPAGNCPAPVDSARPWIKRRLGCTVVNSVSGAWPDGTIVYLDLTSVQPDIPGSGNQIRYRHGSYGESSPLGMRFDASTGVWQGATGNPNLATSPGTPGSPGGNIMDCSTDNATLINLSTSALNANEC